MAKSAYIVAFVLPLAVAIAVRADALDGYEALANWNNLPLSTTGVQAGLFSSFNASTTDPNATFTDYDHYAGYSNTGTLLTVDPNTGLNIVGAISGPGEIDRTWMPHFNGTLVEPIKIFLNVNLSDPNATLNATPAINSDSTSLLLNNSFNTSTQTGSPLVRTLLGGTSSYEPITFQQSALIEMGTPIGGNPNYYQFGYHTFPQGTTIPTYSTSQTPPASRATVVNMLNNVGGNPGGTPTSTAPTASGSISAGGVMTIASLAGSGQIGALKLQVAPGSTPTDAQLDGLRLRVSYNGNAAPAVDVPVSQFFGVGHGRAAYQSLPMGVNSDGSYYCYFPMPFQSGATVQLYNSTGASIPVSGTVQYSPGAVPANANYFHAVYNSQTTSNNQPSYNLLHISGSGHYVGNVLSIENASNYPTMEGDDTITVDGSSVLHGTGVEDAYNGGYYYNSIGPLTDHGDVANPASGVLPYSGMLSFTSSEKSQYRWMIGDDVPFSQSLDVSLQNANNDNGVTYDSTAFYYSADSVPEPSSLMGTIPAGALLLFIRRRRQRLELRDN